LRRIWLLSKTGTS